MIALDNATRNEFARNRRVVKAMPAKAACQPHTALNFANLRHAMDRTAKRPTPHMRDADFPEARKCPPNVISQPRRNQARVGIPRPHTPRPLQAIAANNTVMIISTVGVADRAAIAHHFMQDIADRFSNHYKRCHRQQSRRKLRHECAEMDIAGKHHMCGTYAACGRDDTLANTGRIERNRGRLFENTRTRFLGERGEPERVIVWIYVKGLPVVHCAEIARAVKLVAHAFLWPKLDIRTDPAHAFNFGAKFVENCQFSIHAASH